MFEIIGQLFVKLQSKMLNCLISQNGKDTLLETFELSECLLSHPVMRWRRFELYDSLQVVNKN